MLHEDRIFRALADPTRRAVLERLMARGQASVKELTARFDVSQPAISQHLATLEEAGLVASSREGRHAYYRVDPRGLRPLVSWIARYRFFWREKLPRLEALLEEMDE
ncbi:MAG TPA: metalloregulator ArsR/SmtB family transcription factor [Myxococcales bacterium]|nr:metalloregulator ArsR/SmtB family transcription factor [Myxococcales bacterium]